jgi:hypothetical protein
VNASGYNRVDPPLIPRSQPSLITGPTDVCSQRSQRIKLVSEEASKRVSFDVYRNQLSIVQASWAGYFAPK